MISIDCVYRKEVTIIYKLVIAEHAQIKNVETVFHPYTKPEPMFFFVLFLYEVFEFCVLITFLLLLFHTAVY